MESRVVARVEYYDVVFVVETLKANNFLFGGTKPVTINFAAVVRDPIGEDIDNGSVGVFGKLDEGFVSLIEGERVGLQVGEQLYVELEIIRLLVVVLVIEEWDREQYGEHKQDHVLLVLF